MWCNLLKVYFMLLFLALAVTVMANAYIEFWPA